MDICACSETKRISWATPNCYQNRLDSLNGYCAHYCYLVLFSINLGETYPGVWFEVLSNTSGFIRYNSGVPCGPKPIIKNDSAYRDFLTSTRSTSAVVVFFDRASS